MPSSDEPTRPMTLDNMRSLGIGEPYVTCQHCGPRDRRQRRGRITSWCRRSARVAVQSVRQSRGHRYPELDTPLYRKLGNADLGKRQG
jgi:hypothetical protein